MNVAELIEYLKTLPPETEVQVLQEFDWDYSSTTNWVTLNENCLYYNSTAKVLELGDK